MARFEFQERGFPLPLDIAGRMFTLRVTKAAAKKLEAYGAEAQRLGAALPDTPEGVEQAWGFLRDTLDGLLGVGATDAIFEEREHDLLDIVDVLNYICGEIESAAKRQEVKAAPPSVPGAKEQSVAQAMRIMQDPEVVAAIEKAMQP